MFPDALELAAQRGVLPTALSSAELQRQFGEAAFNQAVFSARTTSAAYLAQVDAAVRRMLATEAGGYSFEHPEARVMLRNALRALNYDPTRGHFGTPEDANIPPARPGSMQDLSSTRRLDLILDTHRTLFQNAGLRQQMREPDNQHYFPFLELVPSSAHDPRKNWGIRWERIGGTLVEGKRIIAPVDSPHWDALGSHAKFKDAFNSTTPPFAFGSTRIWQQVGREDAIKLGLMTEDGTILDPASIRKPKPNDPDSLIQPTPGQPTPLPLTPPPADIRRDVPTPVPVVPIDANEELVRRIGMNVRYNNLDPTHSFEDGVRRAAQYGNVGNMRLDIY